MQREQGLSLIELLVVMGIIAAITSVAIGMIRRGDSTTLSEAAARVIRADLRLARGSARRAGLGSVVRISPSERLVEVWPSELGGSWHFEDATGARGTQVQVGGKLVDGGYLSRCIECDGSSSTVLGSYPFFDVPNGFRMSLAVNPTAGAAGVLATRPGIFKLTLTDAGALIGEVILAPQGEKIAIETRDGVVPAGVWTEVSLAYDRTTLAVIVSGVTYAAIPESRSVATSPRGPLTVGSGGFVGRMDEARLIVMGAGEISDLPGRVDVLGDEDIVIHFDDRGRLSTAHHSKDISFELSADEDDESTARIEVLLSGLIR